MGSNPWLVILDGITARNLGLGDPKTAHGAQWRRMVPRLGAEGFGPDPLPKART
jgi:hypothetical protein